MNCPLCRQPHCPAFASAEGRDYFRCQRCELTFLDPAQRPDPDSEKAYYALHENDPDDPGYRTWLDRLAIPLCQQLNNPSNGLDFGCGPGPALARTLEERGHQMAVYDPLFAADASVLRWQYDFVTCTEVVEHFHQPAKEFELLARLVRPNGLLAIMTGLLHDRIDFHKWHYRRDPTHVSFYRAQTFQFIGRLHSMTPLSILDNGVIILRKD